MSEQYPDIGKRTFDDKRWEATRDAVVAFVGRSLIQMSPDDIAEVQSIGVTGRRRGLAGVSPYGVKLLNGLAYELVEFLGSPMSCPHDTPERYRKRLYRMGLGADDEGEDLEGT